MLAELQSLPPRFVALPDPKDKTKTVKLCCRASDDARKLHIMAVTMDHGTFLQQFDEPELTKVKATGDASQPWGTFFKELEKNFTAKDIKWQGDAGSATCTVPIGGKAMNFALPKSDVNGPRKFLEDTYQAYELRTTADPEAHLKELQGKEAEGQARVSALEAEKRQWEESITTSETEEKALMEQFQTMTTELKVLQEKHAQECEAKGISQEAWLEEVPIEPDLSTCLARIPLGDTNCRPYDIDLLKLIKSKFQPLTEEGAAGDGDADEKKETTVVVPYTPSEFEGQMKDLPEDSKSFVMKCMEKIDDWGYNVWTMQDMTRRGALFHTAYALFMRHDFLRKFSLDEQVVMNFLSQVEGGYHPNPYHNSMHGADVLHIVHYVVAPGGLKEVAKLTDLDTFAALIAGMIHDYDHPGLNNNFHVKVQSYLANLYNDRSILENHHCAEVFELMKLSQFNILSGLTDEQRRDVRETVIEMVLSTDMGLHAKIFGTWKRRIATDHDLHKRKDDQRLALSMSIKMADISNCGRPEELYLRWAYKLAEEFFLQGDNERNRGDPVSPFMDRFAPSMAKSQIAFMNYIVIPMFESIAEYLPEMHFSVDHCESNKSYWASNDDSV